MVMRFSCLNLILAVVALILSLASGVAAKPSSRQSMGKAATRASAARSTGEVRSARLDVRTLTRTVRAADRVVGAYFSEAQGVVVGGNFVVVPWTFMAEIWLSRPGARIFVDGSSGEIELVDLDLLSNLVLFKTRESLWPALELRQIRTNSPEIGEALSAVSGTNLPLAGARYLRTLSDGVASKYQIDATLSSKGRNPFFFDGSGRLIGSGVAPGNSDSRLITPSASILALIRRHQGRTPSSATGSEQKRRQFFAAQERWSRSIVAERLSFGVQQLECHPKVASVSDQKIAVAVQSVTNLECATRVPLELGAGYQGGISVGLGEATLRVPSEPLVSEFGHSISAPTFEDLERWSSHVNLMTTSECRDLNVRNRQGQRVFLRFCSSALKFEPGLADTAVLAIASDREYKLNFVVARLKGLSQENTKAFMESMVENVRSFR